MPGAPIVIENENGYDPASVGVYENTPASPAAGVVRSNDPNPAVVVSEGTAKSLTEKYSSDARAESNSLSLNTLQKGMAAAMVMQWKEDHPGISMDGVISGATGGTNEYSDRLMDCGIDHVLFEQWKYMNFKTMLRNTGGNFLNELLEEMGVTDAPGRLDKSALLSRWESSDDRQANIFGRSSIKLNEDDGCISENQPVVLDGVCRESEYKPDTGVVEKGLTTKIVGKWVSGDLGQVKTRKQPIVLCSDEGYVAESRPSYNSEVVRERDEMNANETVKKGATKELMGQWSTMNSRGRIVVNRSVVLAEDKGVICENRPEQRTDVVREGDLTESDAVPSEGSAKNLAQRFLQGEQSFSLNRKQIVLAEDEGHVAENCPSNSRTDVYREGVGEGEEDFRSLGLASNMRQKWLNINGSGSGQKQRVININEDDGFISENQPTVRNDVYREGDIVASDLPGAPTGIEDASCVYENTPSGRRDDVYREDDAETDIVPSVSAKNMRSLWKSLEAAEKTVVAKERAIERKRAPPPVRFTPPREINPV